MRREMPPASMTASAKTNIGAATKGNESRPGEIRCASNDIGSLPSRRISAAEMIPSIAAIGIPITIPSKATSDNEPSMSRHFFMKFTPYLANREHTHQGGCNRKRDVSVTHRELQDGKTLIDCDLGDQ